MAPRTILAQLVVALKDDASGGAKALAQNLKGLEKNAVDFAKAMNGAKWGASFTRDLGKLKATDAELAKIRASWGQLQTELAGNKNATLRNTAVRQWANDWRTNLAAVRIAHQQNTEEAIRNAKRQQVEETRAAAQTAREKARQLKETAKEAERSARNASRAEQAAARETARAARESAREQARAAREAAREARRAQVEMRRSEREGGRGAGAVGRSVVRNLGYAAGLGSGTYMVGRGARATTRAGGEAMREEARDYLAGLTPAESQRLGNMALEQSGRFKSLTSTSLHGLYRETATTALGMEGASAIAPELAQGMTVLQSLKGKDDALRQLSGFMRALDTLGRNVNPAEVKSLLDGMARAAGVQGMEYNPMQVFTLAKQARSAGGALSVDFLNKIAPSLIADMGPAAPGTAMATLMSSVVGGTLSGGNTKQKMALQREYGLRNKDNSLAGGDRDLMTQNPHLFAWNRLMPVMQGRGVDVNNESAVSEFLNKIYTRTVADLFGKLISQKDQYQNTIGRLDKAPGLAGATELDSKDPFVALAGVTSQMTNTAAELSKPIIETIIPSLSSLSGTLNQLANTIKNSPELSKTVGETGAATAGGGILGGAAMALRALWQSRGVSGAISGGMRGGLAGAVAGAGASYLFPHALEMVPSVQGVVGGIGGLASGANYTPRDAQGVFDLAEQLRQLNAQMQGIKDRTHPSMVGMPNADLTRLEGEANEVRNRITAGTAGMGDQMVSQLAQGITNGSMSAVQAMDMLMENLRAKARMGITVPINVQPSGGGATPTSTPSAPGRASGGSVHAGGLYQINEYDQEYYIPDQNGRIVDPRRKKAGAGGGSGGSANLTVSNTFQISGSGDAAAIAQEVMSTIDGQIREAARSAFSDYGVELA